MSVKLKSIGNYLEVTLEDTTKKLDLKSNFKFDLNGTNFNLTNQGNSLIAKKPFTYFHDENDNEFANENSFKDFALKNTGQNLSELKVIPSMAIGGNLAVTTNSTGTTFNAFASQECKQLTVSNQTGTTIEVQQGGAGVALQIPTGAFYTFFGITNANQLGIRRTDTSNTQITITARWEA